MRRAFLVLTAVVAIAVAASGRADALEVTCIEASRYRHLYQLFGGDPKQLAAFLELDPRDAAEAGVLPRDSDQRQGRHPRPPMTPTSSSPPSKPTRDGSRRLQLSSGGGIVQTGYQLGFITRLFWLKTQTATAFGRNLNYTPDFFVPPAASGPDTGEEQPDAERIRNWRSFLTAQKGLSPTPLGYAGCASACGLIHTAGVDRAGEVRVHRARVGGAGKDEFINLKATMSETDKRLQRLELEQIAFYRQMDPGPDFIRHYQETPAQTTTPVDVSRFPRYVADYLTGKCKMNGDQLQELDRQIGNTMYRADRTAIRLLDQDRQSAALAAAAPPYARRRRAMHRRRPRKRAALAFRQAVPERLRPQEADGHGR